jgi:hypothetical protein
LASDNPFLESDDSDRTQIIRPTPGGRVRRAETSPEATAAVPPPAAAPSAPVMRNTRL